MKITLIVLYIHRKEIFTLQACHYVFDILQGGMAKSYKCQLQRRIWLSSSPYVVKKNLMFM